MCRRHRCCCHHRRPHHCRILAIINVIVASVCLSDPERGIAGRGTSELQDRQPERGELVSRASRVSSRTDTGEEGALRVAAASRYEGDGLRNLIQFRGM